MPGLTGRDLGPARAGGIARLGPVTDGLLDRGRRAELLRQVLAGFELELLERTPVEYRCYCSRGR